MAVPSSPVISNFTTKSKYKTKSEYNLFTYSTIYIFTYIDDSEICWILYVEREIKGLVSLL